MLSDGRNGDGVVWLPETFAKRLHRRSEKRIAVGVFNDSHSCLTSLAQPKMVGYPCPPILCANRPAAARLRLPGPGCLLPHGGPLRIAMTSRSEATIAFA